MSFKGFVSGVVIVLLLIMAVTLTDIADSLEQRNKIECVKLRESADSVGKIDREACPYDMGGHP